MARPRTYKISLTDQEYSTIKKLSCNKTIGKIVKFRCQILLDLDDAHGKSLTHAQCVKANGTCPMTVHNIAKKNEKNCIILSFLQWWFSVDSSFSLHWFFANTSENVHWISIECPSNVHRFDGHSMEIWWWYFVVITEYWRIIDR